MVSINYSAREVCCKIVYYGPGLSGKTTNLQYVHSKVPGNTRGDLISLATESDRTLYFDFLPINIGTINGFAAKFQLYTVPGQVYYNATRKLVLRGVDGIVFVADSQPDKMDENIESLANLEDNLIEYGYDINTLPMVIQYNKRDLPGILSVEQLNEQLNPVGRQFFEASATIGNGVFDTLKLIIKLVLDKAKKAGQKSTPKVQEVKPSTKQPVSAQQPLPKPEASSPESSVSSSADDSAETDSAETDSVESVPHKTTRQDGVPSVSSERGTEKQTRETVVDKEPLPSGQYRPYPGNTPVQTKEKKISATKFSPGLTSESSENAAGQKALQANNGDAEQSSAEGYSPSMAPSLRRRTEKKKRGFFKRLFGIK